MALIFSQEPETTAPEYMEEVNTTNIDSDTDETTGTQDEDPFLNEYSRPMDTVEREEIADNSPRPEAKGKPKGDPKSLYVCQLANNAQDFLFTKLAAETKEDVFKLDDDAVKEIAYAYDAAFPNTVLSFSPKTQFYLLLARHLGGNFSKALSVRKKNKKIKHLKEQLRELKLKNKIRETEEKLKAYAEPSS